MATALKLPYVRFVRQITTSPGANPQFVAMMEDGLSALKAAAWRPAAASLSSIAMPSNDPLNFAPDDKYDAYKASKTTAASGVQTCNLGMAAYRYKIPADAISGSHYVQSVVATVGADKFSYSGVKVAFILSDSATPPVSWALLRSGGLGTTPDATGEFATYDADPEVYGVLNSRDQASVSSATNKAEEFTFDLSSVAANYAYLYVIISMYDYTDYRANRPYWIEGCGVLNGESLEVTLEGTVTADADTTWDGWSGAGGMRFFYATPPYYYDHCYQTQMVQASLDPWQIMAAFPRVGTVTNTAFAGGTGCSVGVDTGGTVLGASIVRYLPMGETDSYRRVRFSNAAFLPLAGKTVKMRMVVWAGVDATADGFATRSQVVITDETGILQPALYTGSASSATVANAYWAATPATARTAWSMTKIAQYDLQDADYTDADTFSLALTGAGVRVILVTFMPIAYWGAVGAGTKTTLVPGTTLYFS
jgi:hypothetical protein